LGKAERQVSLQEGRSASESIQEIHLSSPDECSHAQEIIGNDEGKVAERKKAA